MYYPKITIITPSFNQGQFLEETILSIISQNYPNLEYIIIDGGSNDNSVEIIKKYEKHLKYWVSEKDKGQSHAINKGLEKASGELVNWINSDDKLEERSLFAIAELFNTHSACVLFCGKLRTINGASSTIQANLDINLLKKGSFRNIAIRQQSNFFNTNYLKSLGNVNELLHYVMDAELIFKALINVSPNEIAFTNAIIGCYRVQPEAKGSLKIWDFVDELYIIYKSLAKIVVDQKSEMFFEKKIKNRILLNKYKFNVTNLKIEKVNVLLNYQICNWIDYYYADKKYDIVKSFSKLVDYSNLHKIDRRYYRLLFIKSILRNAYQKVLKK